MTSTADKELNDLQAANTRQTLTLAGLARRNARQALQDWGKETAKTFAAINGDIGRFEAQTRAQWAANRAPLSFALRRRMVVNGKERKAAGERFGASSGQLMDMVGRIGGAAQAAATFEEGNQAIGRSATLTVGQLAAMSDQVLQVARDANQSTQDVQKAFGQMLDGGMRFDAVAGSIDNVSRAAKATHVDIDAMATLVQSLQQSLGVSPQGLEQALGAIAMASESGHVKMAQMAELLPELAPGFQRLGMSGADGVASMAAAVQVARSGATSDKQAAGNTQAFLEDLVSPDVAERASATLGINLGQIMRQARMGSGNPFDAAIRSILQATAGDLSTLDQVFQGSGSSAFLRSMSADWTRYGVVRRQALEQGEGAIDARMDKASEGLGFKLDRLGQSFERLKLVFGQAMGPVVGKVADGLAGVLDTATGLVQKNPQLVSGVTSVGVAFAAIGTVVNGAQWAFRTVEGPVLRVMGFLQRWQGGQTLLQMARLGNVVLRVGSAVRWMAMLIGGIGTGPLAAVVGVLLLAAGAISHYWNGFKEMFSGVGAGIVDSLQPSLALLMDTLSELQPVWDQVAGVLGWVKDGIVELIRPADLGAATLGKWHVVGHLIGQSMTLAVRAIIGVVAAAVETVVLVTKANNVARLLVAGEGKAAMAAGAALFSDAGGWMKRLGTTLTPLDRKPAVEAGARTALQIQADQKRERANRAAAAQADVDARTVQGLPGKPGVELGIAQGKVPPGAATAPRAGASAPTASTMVNHWNITQLAGESGDALARRVIDILEREKGIQQRSALSDGVFN